MSSPFSFKKLLQGVFAGILSGPVTMLLSYVIGVAVVAYNTRDFWVTALTSASFLPLMLLLVLLIPTVLMGVLIGLVIGLVANISRRLIIPAGVVGGVLLSEVILSVILPLIMTPESNDFTSIISSYSVSGIYGVVLGGVAGLIMYWISK